MARSQKKADKNGRGKIFSIQSLRLARAYMPAEKKKGISNVAWMMVSV